MMCALKLNGTILRVMAALAGSAILTCSIAAPSVAHAAQADSDGLLLTSEPYRFPYQSRVEWLAFVAGLPGGEAAVKDYETLFSAEDYAGYAQGRTTITTRITYRSDGRQIRGIMVAPRSSGRHPVIIFNHGGIGEIGRIVLGDILEFNRLAARGYVVLASTYRGEQGSEGSPDMDGGDVADTLALLKVAAQVPGADVTRVGMWGFSRGGFVAYGALAKTDSIAAAVIMGGPTDLAGAPRRAEFDKFVYPDVIHDYALGPDAALARLSPIRWPDKLNAATPILILQGGDDARVPPTDALRMATALQALRRSYRLKVYEGGSHDLLNDFADVRIEIDRWFDRYVRDRQTGPRNGVTQLSPEETGVK